MYSGAEALKRVCKLSKARDETHPLSAAAELLSTVSVAIDRELSLPPLPPCRESDEEYSEEEEEEEEEDASEDSSDDDGAPLVPTKAGARIAAVREFLLRNHRRLFTAEQIHSAEISFEYRVHPRSIRTATGHISEVSRKVLGAMLRDCKGEHWHKVRRNKWKSL